ncbi:unnamed protein product [Bubo scandiacus]
MMDTQKTTNGLQVIGEGTGIGKSTLHMVGTVILWKQLHMSIVQSAKRRDRSKFYGLTRINFQESIFLCENPQCIYPLGYKPLNSIITSADSENHQVSSTHKKRKLFRKTLTTFTNIIPDWHPLNAIHIGPCNNCSDRSQRRQMILEKVPPILMLHFVEGLPT